MGGGEDTRRFEPRSSQGPSWIGEVARDAACVAILAGLVFALFSRTFLHGEHILRSGTRDSYIFVYPIFDYVHHRIHVEHELPLWNPYVACGVPCLAGNLATVFSPLNVVLAIRDPLLAYSVQVALQMWLAGVFLYVFLRTIQLGRHAALVGAVWYAFNGMFVYYLPEKPVVAGALYLPLVFAALHKAFQNASWPWTGVAAFLWGVQVLSGNLQSDVYMVAALCLFAATACGGRAGLLRRLVMLGVAMAVGSAVAGGQLVPGFELVGSATRPPRYAGMNYLPVGALSSLFTSGVVHDATGLRLWIGALGLVLALLSVRLRSVYWVKYFWGLFALVIGGLLLLRVPAISAFASRIPHWNELYHARAMFFCPLAVSILAAIRLDWTLSKTRLDVERKAGLVVGLALAALAGGLLWVRHHPPQGLDLRDKIDPSVFQAIFLAASGAAVAGLFFLGTSATRWLVLPIAALDVLVPAAHGIRFSDDRAIYQGPETPPETGSLRLKGSRDVYAPDTLLPLRRRDANGFESILPAGYAAYMSWVEYGGQGRMDVAIEVARPRHPFLAAAGVAYAWDGRWNDTRTVGLPAGGTMQARRAWFAEGAMVEAGRSTNERLEALERAMSIRPATVLLEKDLPMGSGSVDPPEIVVDDPERVVLSVKGLGERRLLVLADTAFPGWEATIDGTPTEIHTANLWMRAVEVPPGDHQVEFRYRPKSLGRGLALSATGVALSLLLLALGLRRPVVQPLS